MNKINDFTLWNKEPNTICKGARIYTRTLFFNTKNRYKKRLIRVYIPSTYDFNNPNKRFPVLYMLDGKNLFDDYTSFVGEWGVDESIEEAIKNKKTEGIIVVGVDAPKNGTARALEMLIEGIEPKDPKAVGYASVLGDFIFKELKPIIDDTFFTLKDKKHTAVGGSSMGGLMAFYLAIKYQEYAQYSLAFSPAFFLFKKESFKKYLLDNVSKDKDIGKIYFYVGGIGFEKQFIKTTLYTYQYMERIGFNNQEIKFIYDENQEHNEKAWRIYFPDALEFFNYFK